MNIEDIREDDDMLDLGDAMEQTEGDGNFPGEQDVRLPIA